MNVKSSVPRVCQGMLGRSGMTGIRVSLGWELWYCWQGVQVLISDGLVDARPVNAGSGMLLAPCDTLVSCMDILHELVTKFLRDDHTSPFQDQPVLDTKFVTKGPVVTCGAVGVTASGWEPCRYVLHEMAQHWVFPGGSSQLFQSGRAKLHQWDLNIQLDFRVSVPRRQPG